MVLFCVTDDQLTIPKLPSFRAPIVELPQSPPQPISAQLYKDELKIVPTDASATEKAAPTSRKGISWKNVNGTGSYKSVYAICTTRTTRIMITTITTTTTVSTRKNATFLSAPRQIYKRLCQSVGWFVDHETYFF